MGRSKNRRANKPFSLKAAIAELEGDTAAVEKRREQLAAAISRFPGAALRDDSRLAYQFIVADGEGANMEAAAVAAEMACVQQLHSETDYGKTVQREMRQVAQWARAHYGAVAWSDIWAIVRETFVPACKLEATKRLLRSRRLKESAREAACGPEAVAAA